MSVLRAYGGLALLLLAVLTGIGLLVSREWGWSEYASPELYLIHWQQMGRRGEWRIVSASDGAHASLALGAESILALDCSPDGRTLALLDDSRHLHVINAGGLAYERPLDPAYDSLTVANDGRVTLYNPALGGLRVDAQTSEPFGNPPEADIRYRAAFGADGWGLWNADANLVQFVSPDGELRRSIFPVSGGRWLADERLVSFGAPGDELRQYVMEADRPALVTLHQAPGVFAPDGLTRAMVLVDEQRSGFGIFISGAFGNTRLRAIPHIPGGSEWPVCFITFWPKLAAGQ